MRVFAGLLLLAVAASDGNAQTLSSSIEQCAVGQTCRPRLTWSGWPCTPTATALPSGGGWTGTKAASGSQLVSSITATRDYRLSCTVVEGVGSTRLTWQPPAANTDGTPLTDLASFRAHYGRTQGTYPNSVAIASASATSYTVDNLAAGSWYFVLTALNQAGTESQFSNVASKTIEGSSTLLERSVTVTVGDPVPVIPATPTSVETAGTYTSQLGERRYSVGDVVPVSASTAQGATRYEWEFEHVENRIVSGAETTAAAATWTPSRPGHYVVRVRACNTAGCSPWFSTTDAGYLMHAWLRAPTF